MTDTPKSAEKWKQAIELAGKDDAYKKFETKGTEIVKRYRDERENNSDARYNILWSNIQTLFPAVYSRKPKAQADRRYKDNDPVGRTAAQILERALQYEIDHYPDYDSSIRNSLKDRLLPGRGVAWVRYENDGIGMQLTEDVQDDDSTPEAGEESYSHECSPTDYVYWKDFRHATARTWEEVPWVARRVYMGRDEGVKRFGEKFKQVPLSHVPKGLDDKKSSTSDELKKAIVWEIWDKPSKTVIWIAQDYANILDEKQDPLQLENFFPCPKPLFATLTTDTLVPVADYLLYQDQANELDELTNRINKLAEACKVVGVYDATQTGVERMLSEGTENTLIPVDSWAAFAEKGGIKGTVDWLPLEMVVNALNNLYTAREQCKQIIYEVTGLSDIIRGASVASETATAQQIKSNFASLRLKELQNAVAVFASDLLRIKAEIMCSFYKPETLIQMSGIQNTLDAPYAEQAVMLLKQNSIRDYRIEVAADSLVELDEKAEQESRVAFLQAVGGFLNSALKAPPAMAPLLGEMLLFGVRGFKAGRDVEAAFDQAMQQLRNPQPQGPSEEQMQMQADQQQAQQQMQLDMQKHQMELQQRAQEQQMQAQLEAHRNELEYQRQIQQQQHEEMLHKMELQAKAQTDLLLAHIDRLTKLEVAEISAQTTLNSAQISAANQGAQDA